MLEREALDGARVRSQSLRGRRGVRPAREDRPGGTRLPDRPALLQHSLARAASGQRSAVSLNRVLITGGGGQLATDLERALSARGAAVHAPPRIRLDITDQPS